MGFAYPVSADKKVIRGLDIAVVVWTMLWLTLAIITALEVRALRQLSTTLIHSSDVLVETADVLSAIQDVPVIGSRVEDVEASVRTAADSARESGSASRDNINDLSILLGVLIFLVPVVPILFLYMPLRVSWNREVDVIRRGWRTAGEDPAFIDFLAERGKQNLGFDRLRELGLQPWDAVTKERRDELARAELQRLGIDNRTES